MAINTDLRSDQQQNIVLFGVSYCRSGCQQGDVREGQTAGAATAGSGRFVTKLVEQLIMDMVFSPFGELKIKELQCYVGLQK